MRVAVAIATMACAGTLSAQGGVVTGRISDAATSRPIAGVVVSLDDSARGVRTDSGGQYRIADLAGGAHHLFVRTPGYAPVRMIFRVEPDSTLVRDLPLTPVAGTALAPVVVIGASGSRVPAKLAGFEFRRAAGIGRFLTETDLNAGVDGERTGNVLMKRLTGVSLEHSGASDYVASTRVQSRYAFTSPRLAKCFAQVYLDGNMVYGGTEAESLFDINSVPVKQLAAVEYYAGPGQMPVEYTKTGAMCGVLLLWTK